MYQRIFVPVDGSGASAEGLNEAIKLAEVHGSELRLFHIVNEMVLDPGYGPGYYGNDFFEAVRKGGQEILDAAKAVAAQADMQPSCLLLESLGGPIPL